MSKKDRDILDELFRDKLYDFEADTTPEDWEAISSRLQQQAPAVRPFHRYRRYWSAAAVVALLMVTSTFYIIKNSPDDIQQQIAEQIIQEIQETEEQPDVPGIPSLIEPNEPAALIIPQKTESVKQLVADIIGKEKIKIETLSIQSKSKIQIEIEPEVSSGYSIEPIQIISSTLVADVIQPEKKKNQPARKWGFGMGGGSLSAGSADNSAPGLLRASSSQKDETAQFYNSIISRYFDENTVKTNMKHKTPVSFSVGVSRYLNNRVTLHSGLSYTMLKSTWEQKAGYRSESKMHLHYLGIPLSASYKIAEWNRFQVYATGGGMVEYNISGKERIKVFQGEELIDLETNNDPMDKKWYWSLHARAGVSYPVIRFVNIFAEGGASYYFDNGSKIETIHSEKPFNVSLNFGFRLGF